MPKKANKPTPKPKPKRLQGTAKPLTYGPRVNPSGKKNPDK